MMHCSYRLYVVSKCYASWCVTCTSSLTAQLEESGKRTIAQIKPQGASPKWLQPLWSTHDHIHRDKDKE